ncbi:histidine--tRNA ligase [Paenibacillus sp. R14(2021)]|uniref:histidine--tRNA ligase n=1 Tax=Paenibacillus sp. R14(2021) TaxID=2859228 RepID=UPI001C611307|nr:histidine--tRNA ligase [Paenibacillus sp. R14(2021)]
MQNVKGTYDYFGKEQALRKKVKDTLVTWFERYDFDEMDSTLLNEIELLASKYAGGDEILKEMYQLTDQGQRKLGLRYDLTIPFAKVIALNPGIDLPFRRYEIGKVFRDGPVKRGRLREFLQCDVDVVGIAGPEAEAELMQLAADVFRTLDIAVALRWNNRRFLGEVLAAVGVPDTEMLTVMLTLDKIEKIGAEGVRAELGTKGLDPAAAAAILDLMAMERPTLEQLTEKYKLGGSPGALEAATLQRLIRDIGLEASCRFDPFLSRGLSFYTGTVYEIFDASGTFTSSLGGGGRYDAIIGQLVGRDDIAYPTVGLSFGMESIMAMLEGRSIETRAAEAVVIPIGENVPEALRAADVLRKQGIRTRTEAGRKLKKALAAASAKGTPYAILIGEEEKCNNQVRLKAMNEKSEFVLTIEEAVAYMKERRPN